MKRVLIDGGTPGDGTGILHPILRTSFYVDTPGLGSSDLRRFPYRPIPRPMAPLDP